MTLTQLELPLASAPPSPAEYLTIAEAAERVRCCERTIRRAIESGGSAPAASAAPATRAAATASAQPTSMWGEVSSNPVKVVRKPRQGRRRVVTRLPPEAVESIRARLLRTGHERSAVLVSVLAYAGLRPGEALALEVRHVRERTLLIEQAVSHGV